MNELELATPSSIVGIGVPLYEQVALAFLVRYRNKLTRDSYARALKQWFTWCLNNGIEPLEAKRVQIELWQRVLEAAGNKPSTIAGKINAVVGYYRLAAHDEHIEKDPTSYLLRQKVPRESTTNGLTRLQLWNCLEAAMELGKREHALICILGLNGTRIGETLAIDIEDIGAERGHHTIALRRKGGKTQRVPSSSTRATWPAHRCSQPNWNDSGSAPPTVPTTSSRRCTTGTRLPPTNARSSTPNATDAPNNPPSPTSSNPRKPVPALSEPPEPPKKRPTTRPPGTAQPQICKTPGQTHENRFRPKSEPAGTGITVPRFHGAPL